MTCEHCRERLMELSLDEIADELGPHLDVCPACARLAGTLLAEERALHDALASWLAAPTEAAVQAALDTTHPEPRSRPMFHSLHLVMIAVAAAAALLLGLRLDDGGAPAAPTTLAAAPAVTPVDARIRDIAAIRWNEKSSREWAQIADELRDLYGSLPEADVHRFDALAQMGRAAENANDPAPPYFREVGDGAVNVAWYLAAVRAQGDDALLQRVGDDIAARIRIYLNRIERGDLPVEAIELER